MIKAIDANMYLYLFVENIAPYTGDRYSKLHTF